MVMWIICSEVFTQSHKLPTIWSRLSHSCSSSFLYSVPLFLYNKEEDNTIKCLKHALSDSGFAKNNQETRGEEVISIS